MRQKVLIFSKLFVIWVYWDCHMTQLTSQILWELKENQAKRKCQIINHYQIKLNPVPLKYAFLWILKDSTINEISFSQLFEGKTVNLE